MSAAWSVVLGGSATLLCPGLAPAQDATWVGATPDWNTPSNWSPSGVPTGTTIFNSSTQTSITFSEPITVGALEFNAPGYRFSTTAMNITGNGIQATAPNAPNMNFFNSGAANFLGSSSAGPATVTLGEKGNIDDFNGGFALFL